MKVTSCSPTMDALTAIFNERVRQVDELGHTPQHDTETHMRGCLARAAASRLLMTASRAVETEHQQLARELRNMAILADPWSRAADIVQAPTERLLVEAGALAAAELERVSGDDHA